MQQNSRNHVQQSGGRDQKNEVSLKNSDDPNDFTTRAHPEFVHLRQLITEKYAECKH